MFVRNKKIKSNFWANEQDNEIDSFCCLIHGDITNLFERQTLMLNKIIPKKN